MSYQRRLWQYELLELVSTVKIRGTLCFNKRRQANATCDSCVHCFFDLCSSKRGEREGQGQERKRVNGVSVFFCFPTKLLILHETSTGNFVFLKVHSIVLLAEWQRKKRESRSGKTFISLALVLRSVSSILGIVSASSTASASVTTRTGLEHKKSVTFDDGFKPGVEAAAAAATNIMASNKTRTNGAEVEQISSAFKRGSSR